RPSGDTYTYTRAMRNFMMGCCSHGTTSRQKILYRLQPGGYQRAGFSLMEVVIALGVITVGIVGILAVIPTALQTGHSAQDETRGAHIAQSIFGSLVAGATSQFNNVRLPPTPVTINLTASASPTSPTLYADNDGNLIPNSTNAAYAIFVYTNNSVPGFTDPGTANM